MKRGREREQRRHGVCVLLLMMMMMMTVMTFVLSTTVACSGGDAATSASETNPASGNEAEGDGDGYGSAGGADGGRLISDSSDTTTTTTTKKKDSGGPPATNHRRYAIVGRITRGFASPTTGDERALTGSTSVIEPPTVQYPLAPIGVGCPATTPASDQEGHLVSIGARVIAPLGSDRIELQRSDTSPIVSPLLATNTNPSRPRYEPTPQHVDRFISMGTYDLVVASVPTLSTKAAFVVPPEAKLTSPNNGDVDGSKNAAFGWDALPHPGSVTYTELIAFEGTTERFRCVAAPPTTVIQVPPTLMAAHRGKTLLFTLSHVKVTETALPTGAFAVMAALNSSRREIKIK